MIPIPLRVIVQRIHGRVVRGSGPLVIKHVAHRLKGFKPHLFYFHLNRRPGWNPDPRIQPDVIVTDNPAFFARRTPNRTTIVAVRDGEVAYMRFIKFYRSLLNLPIIGVTGTCGKTTTVEMIKHILSYKWNVQATRDGENGLGQNLGYLTGMDGETDAAVFELGTNAPGVIRRSCTYFKPTVGVLLNIGVYHLQYSGTLENYIKAKSEIVDGVMPGGTLIINDDDENIKKINVRSFRGRLVRIGFKRGADYWADQIVEKNGGVHFMLNHRGLVVPVFVPGYGVHNVYNAMATLAACQAVGVPLDQAARLLATFRPMRMHLEFKKGVNGCTLIDDSWNSNPPGMRAALQVLKDQAKGRNAVAVLGFMPELGVNGRKEYAKIGEFLQDKVDHLILVGKDTRLIGLRAIEVGMDPSRVHYCETGDEVYRALLPHLHPHSLILLKIPYHYDLYDIPSFQKLMEKISNG